MAPDRGGSTATLNPVADRLWAAATLDAIPTTETLTALLDRGKPIRASTTCMGAVGNAEEGGLVICIPISKHATSSSKTICKPILVNQAEERTAPPATRTLKVRSMVTSVTSATHGDNPGVTHDSTDDQAKADHHISAIRQHNHTSHKQALSQCADISERKTSPGPKHNSPQSTNIELHHVKQFSQRASQRDAYCNKFGARTQSSCRNCTGSDVVCSSEGSCTPCGNTSPTPHGKKEAPLSNWLRAVKPEVSCPTSPDVEEIWPPLLAQRTKGKTFGSSGTDSSVSCIHSQYTTKPRLAANYEQKDVVLLSNSESESNTHTAASPHFEPELLLDEQSWPSLQKSCKHNVLHDVGGSDKKRKTLQPLVSSNFHHPRLAHTMQDQSQRVQHHTPHVGFCTTEKLHIPPLLLMLNKDFVVTSPLKQNLLLTLALMGKRSDVDAPESLQSRSTEGETKRQILVGQFKAFSSYIHFMLGRDATRVRTESNAGGTSTISESLSVEYFVRRFQAKDIVTEMEVEYQSFNWKKVDFICTLYGQRVGVSVTRAMSFPDPKDFSAQMAYRLLYKKLFGLVVARHGVSKRHSFSQCILHVWCETKQTARMMQTEYDGVSQELDIADDVVMVLTVADGCHARPIFYESLLRNF